MYVFFGAVPAVLADFDAMSLGIGVGAGIVVGVVVAMLVIKNMASSSLKRGQAEAVDVLAKAQSQANEMIRKSEVDGKAEYLKIKEAADKEVETIRKEIREGEQRLQKREDVLDRKLDTLSMKEKNLDGLERSITDRKKNIEAKDKALDETMAQQKEMLLRIANMSVDEARQLLLGRIENETRHDTALMVARIEDQAKEEAKAKSMNIMLQAMQRYAAEVTSEGTTKSVEIPSDDMKGRIIGREGRNIRAFEQATGVDVIIDDTPGLITVNCFDPVRREVAKITMEKLIADGRIHPARGSRKSSISRRRKSRTTSGRWAKRRRWNAISRGCIRRSSRRSAGCITARAMDRMCCGTRSKWRFFRR